MPLRLHLQKKKITLIDEKHENALNNDANSTESVVEEVIKGAKGVVNKTANEVVASTEGNNSDTPQTISTITINPTRGNLWFGFINLDTKKRREFMKKTSTPFDIKGGRWLLVTGHGYVDIVSEVKTIELTDSKKHFFYIDSHELKILTRREFRNMNGRRGW